MRSRTALGFGCGSDTAFAAELNPRYCGLGKSRAKTPRGCAEIGVRRVRGRMALLDDRSDQCQAAASLEGSPASRHLVNHGTKTENI